MKKTILLIAAMGLMVCGLAEARQYGMAGCGLGSQVFKDDKLVDQVLGATTNGTSYNQTFGITSGTSGCTDDGTVRADRVAPAFIENNQIALANDIARGNGETIEHLSAVLGCADAKRMGSTLQKNYHSIFSTDNIKGARVTDSIIDTVRSDSDLAKGCKNLI